MMHYRKGQNIEKEIKKEELPFDDCLPNGNKDFLWMHVKGGTKVNNVITFAKNALDKGEHRTIVWTGAGGGLVKTVSCAEIIKRTHPLYQVTRMGYTETEEHWLPQMEGLDEIVVKRKTPCIHILMSLDEIDESVFGLQKPNTTTTFYEDPVVVGTQKRQGSHRQQARNGGPRQSDQNRNSDTGRGDQRSAKHHQNQKMNENDPEKNQPSSSRPRKNFRKNRPTKNEEAKKPLEPSSSAKKSNASAESKNSGP